MWRKIEFFLYAVIILFFIARFYNGDDRSIRRPAPDLPRAEAPNPVPRQVVEDQPLPRMDEQWVRVDLDRKVQNGVGTAFAVLDGDTYITARHVVDGCGSVYILTGPQGRTQAHRIDVQQNRDFAVLRAGRPHKATLTLADYTPKRGDEGYMMGFPQAKPADVRATIIGRTEMQSGGRYSAREPVIAWVERERRPAFEGALGGISGGPVLNEKGEVIGTVVAGAPRRGRAYSTHPHVFAETGVIGRKGSHHEKIGRDNFSDIGGAYRADGSIVQVYCKVD